MKIKLLRIVALFLLLLSQSFSLIGCSNKTITSTDSFSKIKDRGFIIVGLDDTFAPMGFKNEKGEIVGFDVDLAKEVFKRMGLNVKFQSIDWSMKETELNSNNIDVIWNGYTITDERKEKVAFSKPYLANRQLIIALSSSNISSKKDLKDKNVAAQSGSSSLDAINKEPDVASTFNGGQPILFDNNNDAFMDLETGRVDAIVVDEILARYYIKERGIDKYKILEDDFGKEDYGIGIRKNDFTLLNLIDNTLEKMKIDGTSEDISKKWFQANIIK